MALRLLLVAALAARAAGAAGGVTGLRRREGTRSLSTDASHAKSRSAGAMLHTMVMDWFEAKGATVGQVVREVHSAMNFQEAYHKVADKLPSDVMSLLEAMNRSSGVDLDEDALQKARAILNGQISGSLARLDDILVGCNEFKRGNRESFDQVSADLARLGSEIAQREEAIGESLGCIGTQSQDFTKISEKLQEKAAAHIMVRAESDAELKARKTDFDVFNVLLKITECRESTGTGFLQMTAPRRAGPTSIRVCSTQDGLELHFEDLETDKEVRRMMTPEVRKALQAALVLDTGPLKDEHLKMSLLQQLPNSSVTMPPLGGTVTQPPVAVREEPVRSRQWRKCSDGEPNCGVLHDQMSLQWGQFKDLVDELQTELARHQDDWEQMKHNVNGQLELITEQKTECQSQLDAATGQKNTLIEERKEKDRQYHELSREYEHKMAACKAKVEELLYTDICAVKTVRNELMMSSKMSPPSAIVDCDVGDWVPSECSVECDDSCPHIVGGTIDPYQCGGDVELQRQAVVASNQYGVPCPALQRNVKCGQHKCPVDCVMSQWSGWSKCTKECEGGVQQMTRSVITKPRHGGTACPATVEARTCNTDSCDQDCVLSDWDGWSPCSMACRPGDQPGFQERRRQVLTPIRGEGRCPTSSSLERWQTRACNEQPCRGDEICVAKQDLIIAIDGSGSVQEAGFAVLRNFTASLLAKFTTTYYGMDTMQVGIVLFGNGAIRADNTIAPAMQVQRLTRDLALVRTKLQALTWQKGFTNMAQAFALADTMFSHGGRAYAQSSVLVLSDGKYSFAAETETVVDALKARNTAIYMAPVADAEGVWAEKLKHWASKPWTNNYEFIPGMADLGNNQGIFTSRLIAKFCPESISPDNEAVQEQSQGYMLIHEGGLPSNQCGELYDLGWVASADDCMDTAVNAGLQVFAVGVGYQRSGTMQCYGEAGVLFNVSVWSQWLHNRVDVKPCPGGSWVANPYFDVFAAAPAN